MVPTFESVDVYFGFIPILTLIIPEHVTLWPHGFNVTVAVFSEQTMQSGTVDSVQSWVFL